VKRLASGKFRVVAFLGLAPITGRPIQLSRTFDTEHEAVAFRDTLLRDPAQFLEKLRERLQIAAIPLPPGGPLEQMYSVRGRRVILDADLARLLGTRTRVLNQAVSRNRQRFPEDFAFHLTKDEVVGLRSLGATAQPEHGGRRTLPRVFTDLGLVMAAAVIRSSAAVGLNIEVVRTVCAAGRVPGQAPLN
jgi:hypothetical protein